MERAVSKEDAVAAPADGGPDAPLPAMVVMIPEVLILR